MIPSVTDCRNAIQKWSNPTLSSDTPGGHPGSVPSIFFTSSQVYGDLAEDATKWAASYFGCSKKGFATWSSMVDQAWLADTKDVIQRVYKATERSAADLETAVDQFLKNLSQAYAEESVGNAYLIMPASQNGKWDFESAWAGWEYPALRANVKIGNIYRVDVFLQPFDEKDAPGWGPQFGDPVLLWK